jgi:hypothetical protein
VCVCFRRKQKCQVDGLPYQKETVKRIRSTHTILTSRSSLHNTYITGITKTNNRLTMIYSSDDSTITTTSIHSQVMSPSTLTMLWLLLQPQQPLPKKIYRHRHRHCRIKSRCSCVSSRLSIKQSHTKQKRLNACHRQI